MDLSFLQGFEYEGKKTDIIEIELGGEKVKQYINEFWTSKQRQSNSIHEVSYRACFKAELPRFFIERFTKEGDIVYDPFSGRGTTAIEAGLLGRNVKACEKINENGIFCERVNEVGNRMEDVIRDVIREEGLYCDKPKDSAGNKKSTGYPDLEFKDQDSVFNYLECKTYNHKTLDSTMRTFYLSPSENAKVTRDAIHYVISLEMYPVSEKTYKTHGWKILSIKDLKVNLKHEFNASNKDLYGGELILAEGEAD